MRAYRVGVGERPAFTIGGTAFWARDQVSKRHTAALGFDQPPVVSGGERIYPRGLPACQPLVVLEALDQDHRFQADVPGPRGKRQDDLATIERMMAEPAALRQDLGLLISARRLHGDTWDLRPTPLHSQILLGPTDILWE